MVATRSLQLTVKKTTRQQKTLEGQLLMIKDGERTAISSRVAELDQILPQYLGVSRAVLDSVIFCHQDESLWPMSEPSVLKKKFDDIFEVLKYTKAIDNIKALRKKQNEELGKFKIMEQYAKEDKDKADKVATYLEPVCETLTWFQAEKKSQQLHNELETLREEIRKLHGQAKEAGDKAQEAWNQVAAYTEVVESLKVARKNKEWCEQHLSDLSQDLKERSESDEWLQNELDQYEARTRIHGQKQQEQAKRFNEVREDIVQVRKHQSDKRLEVGRHEQRKATHEQKIKDRNLDIKETAREHNIRGFEIELDDMGIREYIDKITKLSKDQNSKVDRLRRENIIEIQKVQEVLDSLRDQRSGLEQRKSSAKDQMTDNDKKIATQYTQLDTIIMDEGGKAALEFKIEEQEGNLARLKQDLLSSALETKMRDTNAALQSIEDQSSALNRDLIQATKQAGSLAQLDHLKKEFKDRQRSLETMTRAHGDRLVNIVGPNWQPNTLETDFQSVVETRKRSLLSSERQRDSISRELEQIEFKLKIARTEMKKKETELESCTKILREITLGEADEYPEILATIQSDRDIRKYDVDGYAILKKWYTDCIEIARSDAPACRLCSRAFHDEKSVRIFISKLEKQVSRAALDALQKELKDLDTDLQRAKDGGTSYDTWTRLSENELPNIQAEIIKLEQGRESLLRQIEEHDKIVHEEEEAMRDAETLFKPVANIVKYSNEHASLQSQIRDLTAKQQDSGISRSLEDLQEEIELLGAKSRSLRGNLVKLQDDEKRSRVQISSTEMEIAKSKNKLADANFELEKKAKILLEIEDVKRSNHELRDLTGKLDGQLRGISPQILEQEARRDDLRERGEAKEKDLQREASSLSDSVRNLQRADLEIRAYTEEGGPNTLENCKREVQRYDQNITLLETELKQITVEINKIREELGNHDQNKRDITDNIKYRKTRHELDAVNVEIQQLTAQNAEADQEHHRRQAERYQRQHNLLSTDETSKLGSMKAKDDQLGQLINDWETDYKDAAVKYRRTHIEVEVRSSMSSTNASSLIP